MPNLLHAILGTAAFNTAIAALLALIRFGGTFFENLVFSQCIGFTVIAVFLGTWRLGGGERPRGWRLAAAMGASILAGWLGGTALASWLIGVPWNPKIAGGAVLGITVASSLVGMSYFWQRSRTAAIEREAAEARLRLLQAQIEPHFLFNTLANLDALIQVDPKRARAMLGHLNDWLRATLQATRKEWTTLAEEFAMLRGYLEVQSVRMGPRLRYALELPEGLGSATLPPMLLQPLVENAIKHGLEPKMDGGEIVVRAESRGGRLVIAVSDTGVGSSNAGGHGIGLDNVRQRTAAVGGTMAYANNASGGVTVTLEIPA